MLPADADGAEVGEGLAGAEDESERCGRRVAGVRLDTAAGVNGGGQEGPLQDALAPVLHGTGWFGEQEEHLVRLAAVVQQTALLCFPQQGDGVNRLVAAREGGKALPQSGVQALGEALLRPCPTW